MTKDRLGALKAAQSEDEGDDDMHMDAANAQFMEEFFEQVFVLFNWPFFLISFFSNYLSPTFIAALAISDKK